MENNLSQIINPNESNKNNNNLQIKNDYYIINKKYLSNDDYIKLFYNSKNCGLNKNFPLNVVYNKRKSKSSK